MGEDYECSIKRDFWRASHVAELARSDAFETDSVAVDLETADYDLPYRMRKHHECVGQRMQLVQRASGITFSGDEIGELIFETDWDPYLKHFASRLPSGPTSKWKWDDATAQLVVDIARDPSILAHGVGAIKCRLEEAFLYVGDDYPERSALYNFARLIAHKANITSDDGPPAD